MNDTRKTGRITRVVAAVLTTAALAFVIVSAAAYWLNVGHDPAPYDATVPAVVSGCPTEDSCRIDYSRGVWHITPDTP